MKCKSNQAVVIWGKREKTLFSTMVSFGLLRIGLGVFL